MRQFIDIISENHDPVLDEIISVVNQVNDPIEEVWLFGSRAKETHRPDSDYDVLVVADIDEDDIDYLQDELHGLVESNIEFLVTTPELASDPHSVAFKARQYGRRIS